MASRDETLFKLRQWEAEIKAKNAKNAEEVLKDDVSATVKEVEVVTTGWCWCWTKKPVTSTPGPTATS